MNSQHEHFDIDRIKAISIIEVAKRLGKIKKSGVTHRTLCPWHDDSNPSLVLYYNTHPKMENHCHCFSCGKGGSVIDFVMQKEQWSFQEACRWLSAEFGISTINSPGYYRRPKPIEPPKPVEPNYTYIPMDMVDKMVSAENSLCRCLMQFFRPEAVEWLTEEYHIGCYSRFGHDDYTVFPSIDIHGRVYNLKTQHYCTDLSSPRFAHSDENSCCWLGSILSSEGKLPKDAVFRTSCMFGEHLLSRYPDSMVALVESPKNALIGALSFQQLTWVAVGNKGMFKREILLPLRGRDVIVIPDCDAISEWKHTIGGMTDLANFSLSDICERMAPEDEPKFDIADLILQNLLAMQNSQ